MRTALRNLVRAVFRHDAMNREMNDEMRDHVARATGRLMARGLSRAEAELQARREFGNLGVLTEAGRDARGASWVESVRRDVRYAFRSLRSSPAYTLVAVCSLAIGIGANTAVFSLINSVMLKALPVADAERLFRVTMRDSAPARPGTLGNTVFTNPLWEALRDLGGHEATFAVSGTVTLNLAAGGERHDASGLWVNGDFFNTLGVRPLIGRTIAPSDDYRGCAPVAVVGESFWKSELGGARSAIGAPLAINGTPVTVVGVVPREFFGVDVGTTQQIYVPICTEPLLRGGGQIGSLDKRTNWWLRVMARPKPGVSTGQLSARLRQVSRQVMEQATPERYDAKRKAGFQSTWLDLLPGANGMSAVRSQYSKALEVLMGMVALVLLISCANVANLSLARGAARTRELAIRVAIGASRRRIVRQFLTEATILAVAGTVLGLVIALWASRGLVQMIGTGRDAPVTLDLSLDLRVLAFAIAVCVTTILLFALVPAWRATRVDPQLAMKAGGRGSSDGRARFRFGRGLVAVQSALAFILVVGAGLLMTTFNRITSADPGFDADGVVIASVDMERAIPAPQRASAQRELQAAIAGTPGIQSVSTVSIPPISGWSWNDEVVVRESELLTESSPKLSWFNEVGPNYFRTMGTRLVAGRDFGPEDTPSTPKVAVVNEAFARLAFRDASPIGHVYYTFDMGRRGEPTTIVGVVENSRYQSLRDESEPIIYLTDLQESEGRGSFAFVIRAQVPAPAVTSAVTALSRRVHPGIQLSFTKLRDQLAESVQREKMLAVLSGFFGGLALMLAMIGLYGVLAYTVARRRVEIGIRIALGAARGQVVRLVLGDVGLLVGAGLVFGGAVALAGTKFLGAMLYGVEARDPMTIGGAALLLAAAALVAGAIPARRAAALQPVEALRED
jgi:predicted permease